MRRWDIFCVVVDNYGDIGTCWRLARQLADEHAADVRLWVDDLASFARLCPVASTTAARQFVGPIEVCHWSSDFPTVDVADVVIEAFACNLPENYITAMTQRAVAPIWINLEYLSAEAWVEGCHLLTSSHSRLPLKKHFFFPGFTAKTGGLLREHDLLAARAAFDDSAATQFWSRLGLSELTDQKRGLAPSSVPVPFFSSVGDAGRKDEICVSLFCYDNPALRELLQTWSNGIGAVRVLVTPGPATEQASKWLGHQLEPGVPMRIGSLTIHALPFLSQPEYDQLLWACDVNFVRGEDSFVRAQWAQKPFVWQIYPQADDAHLVKLDAFLAKYLDKSHESEVVRRCWHAWNGLGGIGGAWTDFAANRQPLEQHAKVWVSELDRAGNLADNLMRFVCGN